MNYETAAALITAYFASQWNSPTTVSFDDVPFKVPNNATWARLNIKHVDGYQASMGSPGSNRFRRSGIVTVQIFQPQGQAAVYARQKADQVAAYFLGKNLNGIEFFDVQAREIGNDGEGYFQMNVLAYFYYDAIA